MEQTNDTDYQKDVSNSLKKVATGASIVFLGSIITLVFGFIGRLIIATQWGPNDYGVYALAFSILCICGIISTLGFQQGVTRNIAYRRGEKDYRKIRRYVSISLILGTIAGICSAIVVFIFAEPIALIVFNEEGLIEPLRIFAFAIPFYTINTIIAAIYRGFDDVRPTVYFQSIGISIVYAFLLIVVLILEIDYINVYFAGLATYLIIFIFITGYATKTVTNRKVIRREDLKTPEVKELVYFSLPLLGTAMLQMIISWTDTLMLGGFSTSNVVGIYNVSHSIAQFISFPLGALIIVYLPVLTGLYAKRKYSEIKRNFSIITKWLCSLSLPFFMFVFLFPEATINILFGVDYLPGAQTLRILSLAFMLNNFVGPAGVTLVAMGKARFVLFVTILTAGINVALNAFLIPSYGMVGAATASSISIISVNFLKIGVLYRMGGVHPISKNLLKATIISLILIIIPYMYLQKTKMINIELQALILGSFYIIYILVFIVTRSVDVEDIDMLQMIEDQTGRKTTKIRNFLSRFV